jgi:ABC-2 type transport system ATP-binding protein
MTAELEALALARSYRGRRGLRAVSATFTPGLTLIAGPNGAGKSTLLRLLATTLTPTRGEVRWCGQPVAAHAQSYKSMLGYLPQQFRVYARWRAHEFLTYMARLKGLPEEHIAEAIARTLREVQLETHGSRRVEALSHGEVRRLGLAQALLGRPRVLLLDEPFAGLAPEERLGVLALVAAQARSAVVLVVSHLLGGIESQVGRVLILREGVCVADTTPGGLLDDAGVDIRSTAPLETAYLAFLGGLTADLNGGGAQPAPSWS